MRSARALTSLLHTVQVPSRRQTPSLAMPAAASPQSGATWVFQDAVDPLLLLAQTNELLYGEFLAHWALFLLQIWDEVVKAHNGSLPLTLSGFEEAWCGRAEKRVVTCFGRHV